MGWLLDFGFIYEANMRRIWEGYAVFMKQISIIFPRMRPCTPTSPATGWCCPAPASTPGCPPRRWTSRGPARTRTCGTWSPYSYRRYATSTPRQVWSKEECKLSLASMEVTPLTPGMTLIFEISNLSVHAGIIYINLVALDGMLT